MKKIYLVAALTSAILVAASCSDNLDIKQHGTLNYDTYYQTDEQYLSADAAMYSTYAGLEYNLMLCRNMLTDDFIAGGAQRGDNFDLENMNEFSFDAEESYIQSIFSTYYTVIYKANVILGHVPADGDATAQLVRAEAKVFRAWCYFDLISQFGNPPIVDHELAPSEYNVPNGSTEELWALVEKDLTEAIESGSLVSKTSINDNTTWRVTKEFAEAILGKAYLWQNKYKEAAAEFDKVINSQLYRLAQDTDYAYGDLHRIPNKHNVESIFESNRVYDSNNSYGNFTLFYLMINWRTDHMSGVSGTEVMDTGWGFQCPTKDLYDAFVKDEGVNGYRLNQTMKTYDQLKAMGINVTSNILSYGYFMWKTRPVKADRGYSSDFVYDANALWMRYAEVLLCAAEANFRAGDTGKALSQVNLIRKRAKLPDLTTLTLDDIKLEKRLELCAEGQRYADLVRYSAVDGKDEAYEALKDNGSVYPVMDASGNVTLKPCNKTLYGFKKGKSELLPYPATEIRLNSAIKQNPGY